MKRVLGFLLLLTALTFFGCATAAEQKSPEEAPDGQAVDAVAHATPKGEGWKIDLKGVRRDELWESDLNSWIASEPGMLKELDLERKGEVQQYAAIPLREVIAMVDDPDGSMPYSFRQEEWQSGYDVTLTARDGYTQTFLSSEYEADDLYLAVAKQGVPTAPTLVGNISGQYWVKDIAEISLGLEPVQLGANDFELLLEIGGRNAAYSLKELADHPYYVEDRGNYTNSYGNNFERVWGGVKIVDLLNDFTTLTQDMTVTIQAMDGYEMDYSGSQLLDQQDGRWILAFREDGAFMPEDPGYIRLVKVGPENPTITGHLSARMVKKVLIKEQAFQDFQITLESGGMVEVMDRQTLQSGVATHKSIVSFYDKKQDALVEYMGLPLFEMFSRYPGYRQVTLEGTDGFSITLAAEEIEGNEDVILAMYYGDGTELSDREKPLIIVWDQDAPVVPAGIKPVRNLSRLIVR